MNYLELFESFTQKIVNNAKNTSQKEKRNNVVEIQFEDPEVERICHDHGVYTIGDANKVTSIEDWFKKNEKIKSFNEFKYFTGLKKLENSAFICCYKLEEIILPNKITTIEKSVFSWCKKLYHLTLPNSVTTIEDEAFSWFISLCRIDIPNSVTTIGDYAFEKCKSLYSINIPDSVTSIGSGAFGWCPRLSIVYISNNHPLKKQLQKSYKKYSFYDPNEVKESFTSNVIKKSKNITQEDKRKMIEQIQFEDPEVERICHEHGVYAVSDARKVTSIKEWSYNNDKIQAFNEFKYFTGLKEIENSAFEWCSSLQSIDIPDSVTSIGNGAFSCCFSLRSINIPNSVTTIEGRCFIDCRSLRSINIPNSVTSIGECAFYDCESLQSINIPNSVTIIKERAFDCCTSLQSINIPNSVTSIGLGAFYKCSSLQSINIPNSVTSIGDGAFRGCISLQSINIPNSVTNIGSGVFDRCDSLQSINIPNSVTSIGDGAFYECKSLQSIYISKNHPLLRSLKRKKDTKHCKFIDPSEMNESFTKNVINKVKSTTQEKKREQIVAINFKDPEVERICHDHGVYSIQDAAEVTKISSWFSENSDIKTFDEFKYFTGIKTIEYKAFSFCTALQSITIPNSVSIIEESAFHYCPSLQSINIPDSVTSIEYGAFYRCTSLQSVVIPNSVTSIKERAFIYCGSLRSINIPNSVTSIEECTFIECKALKTINIPNSVTRIGGYAFYECSSLQSINIPDSVTSIGIRSFGKCKNLQSINIPNSVTIIGDQAFEDCRSLQSITIPDSVTIIGERAFRNCNYIWKINISKNCPVYDQIKKQYLNIQLVDPSEINESFTKNIINKVKSTSQEDKRNMIVQIQFEDSEVERICHKLGIYTVSDAREVSNIKGWFYCDYKIHSFNEFKYFTGLKEIGDHAFYFCTSLQSINIPDSVTIIGEEAFYNCSSLQSINIPDSVTSIGEEAFYYCPYLQSINIPNSVTSIGDYAFYECTSLQSINIPNSVTSIGGKVFFNCEDLQSIYISKDCPVYNKVKEEYHNIQLVDPSEINESFTKDAIKKVKSASQEDKRKQIFDEFVNLGLPSGILWSRYNYGAEDIYDFGKKLSYDNAKQLVKSIGSNVWIPSQEEYGELFGNCYKRSIVINDVKCLELTSKINGETIIFPCIGSCSKYWARTIINSRNLAHFVEIYSHGAVDWDDESYDSNFEKNLVRMIKDNE